MTAALDLDLDLHLHLYLHLHGIPRRARLSNALRVFAWQWIQQIRRLGEVDPTDICLPVYLLPGGARRKNWRLRRGPRDAKNRSGTTKPSRNPRGPLHLVQACTTCRGVRMTARAYQARPIKRRRTNAELATLDEQIVAVLSEDHLQSVRHVYYRMTDPRLQEPVEKTENGYDLVQRRILVLRRSGVVPYDWISDATRRGYLLNTFSSAGDFVARMNGLYRADLLKGCSTYVKVWAESRSIAGVIQNDCEELTVKLYTSGGFTSATLAFQAAENINAESNGRAVQILYIGDYDQSGLLIDRSIESEMRSHLDDDVEMYFDRIAINEEQIEAWDMTIKPRKETDTRSPQVKYTVEAEAMPASVLRGLLRDRIEVLLPPDALHVAKVAEEYERAYLRRMAMIMKAKRVA